MNYAIRYTLFFLLSAIVALRATYLRAYYLCAYKALHLSRVLYKSTLFMQNKPNFRKAKMNASPVLTKYYENKQLADMAKINPIQTQSKPIQTQFPKSQNEIKLLFNKGL